MNECLYSLLKQKVRIEKWWIETRDRHLHPTLHASWYTFSIHAKLAAYLKNVLWKKRFHVIQFYFLEKNDTWDAWNMKIIETRRARTRMTGKCRQRREKVQSGKWEAVKNKLSLSFIHRYFFLLAFHWMYIIAVKLQCICDITAAKLVSCEASSSCWLHPSLLPRLSSQHCHLLYSSSLFSFALFYLLPIRFDFRFRCKRQDLLSHKYRSMDLLLCTTLPCSLFKYDINFCALLFAIRKSYMSRIASH